MSEVSKVRIIRRDKLGVKNEMAKQKFDWDSVKGTMLILIGLGVVMGIIILSVGYITHLTMSCQ